MSIQVGEVVRKKSGGPKMDVDARCEDIDGFRCSWFDKSGRLQSGTFPSITLEKVNTKDRSIGINAHRRQLR